MSLVVKGSRPTAGCGRAVFFLRARWRAAITIPAIFATMNARVFFRTFLFLLILFVMIYVGSENTQRVDFRFPLLLDKPVRASGALLYFAVFAAEHAAACGRLGERR